MVHIADVEPRPAPMTTDPNACCPPFLQPADEHINEDPVPLQMQWLATSPCVMSPSLSELLPSTMSPLLSESLPSLSVVNSGMSILSMTSCSQQLHASGVVLVRLRDGDMYDEHMEKRVDGR